MFRAALPPTRRDAAKRLIAGDRRGTTVQDNAPGNRTGGVELSDEQRIYRTVKSAITG